MAEGRVLVIDDSEFVLARVKSVLAEAGYDVQTTTQTVGAGRYLRTCDLVLLDFHMPGIDGAQVLSSLRNAAQSASSPCTFYLFTSDEEIAARYASLGFDGVIRNKGDLNAVVAQVRAAFRMSKMRAIARRKRPESNTGMTPIPDVGAKFHSSPPTAAEAGSRPLSSFPPSLSDSQPDPSPRRPPPPPRIPADDVPGVFDTNKDDDDR